MPAERRPGGVPAELRAGRLPAELTLAFLAYRGAVAAAGMQGLMEFVAFDVHRFEMLQAMHLALPKTPAEELQVARALTSFLIAGNRPYDAAEYFRGAEYQHDFPQQS